MAVLEDDPLRDLPDRSIRRSLQHPDNLRAFLSQAVPELAPHFVCEQARFLDREFPLDDWRGRECDLIIEIPYRTADGLRLALVCVLIEHQSAADRLMPLRLLFYAVSYWERRWRTWEESTPPREPLRLPPVLPLVFYTGHRAWQPGRTLADLLAEPQELHSFAPRWQPLFWNLEEKSPEALLNTAQEWLQVMAVVRVEEEDAATFQRVFTEVLPD